MSDPNTSKNADGPERPEDIALAVTASGGKPGRHLAVATYGEKDLSRETIDLNSGPARNRFINATLKALPGLNGGAEKFREHLERQLLQLAKAPPGPAEPPPAGATEADEDPRQKPLGETRGEIHREAEARLRDPRLIERVGEDIGALGVVGEECNRLLFYLVGCSAQLRRPLAVIGRGASSSGKSFVLEQVTRLFPPEVLLKATKLTTNALYYFPPGELRHRFVFTGERSRVEDDTQAEATRALREMLEAGSLSCWLPVKDNATGDFVSKQISQRGPIAYAETTTRANLFDEDANRCLLLSSDESPGQTRRIIDVTAADAEAPIGAGPDRLCAIHHAIQRMLPRAEVLIPFAGAVGKLYPDNRLEGRRDFRHLLQLVKASALLHFMQRKRGPGGEVVAEMADYKIAERLARGPLGAAASGVGAGATNFLALLRAEFKEQEFTTTGAKDLARRALGVSPRTADSRLHELSACGAVEQTEPSKGKVPAKWKLTGHDPATSEGVLPTVEQVMAALPACERANKPQSLPD